MSKAIAKEDLMLILEALLENRLNNMDILIQQNMVAIISDLMIVGMKMLESIMIR